MAGFICGPAYLATTVTERLSGHRGLTRSGVCAIIIWNGMKKKEIIRGKGGASRAPLLTRLVDVRFIDGQIRRSRLQRDLFFNPRPFFPSLPLDHSDVSIRVQRRTWRVHAKTRRSRLQRDSLQSTWRLNLNRLVEAAQTPLARPAIGAHRAQHRESKELRTQGRKGARMRDVWPGAPPGRHRARRGPARKRQAAHDGDTSWAARWVQTTGRAGAVSFAICILSEKSCSVKTGVRTTGASDPKHPFFTPPKRTQARDDPGTPGRSLRARPLVPARRPTLCQEMMP